MHLQFLALHLEEESPVCDDEVVLGVVGREQLVVEVVDGACQGEQNRSLPAAGCPGQQGRLLRLETRVQLQDLHVKQIQI